MIRGFQFVIKQGAEKQRVIRSADSFRSAELALKVAKSDAKNLLDYSACVTPSDHHTVITIFDEDGHVASIYHKYGNGWVRNQRA